MALVAGASPRRPPPWHDPHLRRRPRRGPRDCVITEYAHPESLVSTDWLAERLDRDPGDPALRVVEVDVEPALYHQGHVPGALAWSWQADLCDMVRRDILSKEAVAELLGRSGIANDTTVVLYGDRDNWFACWAFWQLTIYGHADVRILDGGRRKWIAEGRPLSTETPAVAATAYRAPDADLSHRAFLDEVERRSLQPGWTLIDTRSHEEYTGRILAPPGLPETCQRGGHIPGARNIPWSENCNPDGTFKSRQALEELYRDVDGAEGVIAYCRIGERSSLTWFVLARLLGRANVSNYDGSWTEWGNLVGAPVAVGPEP